MALDNLCEVFGRYIITDFMLRIFLFPEAFRYYVLIFDRLYLFIFYPILYFFSSNKIDSILSNTGIRYFFLLIQLQAITNFSLFDV